MRSNARRARQLVQPSNVIPAWLLPFWRLLKTDANGDYAVAWQLLPAYAPPTIQLPTIEEAAIVLSDHRLI